MVDEHNLFSLPLAMASLFTLRSLSATCSLASTSHPKVSPEIMQTSAHCSGGNSWRFRTGTSYCGVYVAEIKLTRFAPACCLDCSKFTAGKGLISSSSASSGFERRRDGARSRARRLQLRSLQARTSYATQVAEGPNVPCDSCKGSGWLVCDFCEGQKVNVQARNNRIYRRCPSCRAVGVVLCPRCKVFKCVSFPDDKDAVVAP